MQVNPPHGTIGPQTAIRRLASVTNLVHVHNEQSLISHIDPVDHVFYNYPIWRFPWFPNCQSLSKMQNL